MNSDYVITKCKNVMAEWHGEDNLDDYHIDLLASMVTFASVPITNKDVCNSPSDIVLMLTEITKAAFNLGVARGRTLEEA